MGFGRSLRLTSFNAGADGVIQRLSFVVSLVYVLFDFGIDEGVFAIVADKDFVRHSFVFLYCGLEGSRSLRSILLNCLGPRLGASRTSGRFDSLK